MLDVAKRAKITNTAPSGTNDKPRKVKPMTCFPRIRNTTPRMAKSRKAARSSKVMLGGFKIELSSV